MARYFTIVQLTLIIAMAYLGTFIFYRIIENQLETIPVFHGSTKSSAQPRKQKRNPNQRTTQDYRAAIQRDLFDTVKALERSPKETIKKVDVNDLQLTQLGLKLWGTVYGIDGKAFAVIEEKTTRKQRLFSIGDEVESASVEMILREKVVLGVNGKMEILTIERPIGKGYATAARNVSPSPPVSSQLSTDNAGKEVVIQRSRIEDAIQNVNQLMKHVRIRPHFTDGEPDGLKLTGVRPGTIFTEIGFRNGDIITGVNGKQIQSVDDALKFYTSLKNESNVDLQIRRRGKEQAIQYRVED